MISLLCFLGGIEDEGTGEGYYSFCDSQCIIFCESFYDVSRKKRF